MNLFQTSAAVRYLTFFVMSNKGKQSPPPQKKRREIFEHVKTITEIIWQLQQRL